MDLSCEILSALPKSSDDTRENNNNKKNQRYYSDVTENNRQDISGRDKDGESFKVLKKSLAAPAAVKSSLECSIVLICPCSLSKSKLMLELFYGDQNSDGAKVF